MTPRTLAHLSDLHLDLTPGSDARARALVAALEASRVDHVVVTGDLTHGGLEAQARRFRELFAPLLARDALTWVPGNHDRLGDDAGACWMGGRRVCTVERAGLYLVLLDSTGPHNRSPVQSHGALDPAALDAVDRALAHAPPDALVALLVHHHVLPLPEESLPERLATRLGLPHAAELPEGAALVERARGRCDLVLHGHRHVPRAVYVGAGACGRKLQVFNAGSSTELGRVRLFRHARGGLLDEPTWLTSSLPPERKPATHNLGPTLSYLARRLGTLLV